MAAPRYFRRSIQLGAGLVLLLGAFLCWSLWRSEISRVPVTDHRRASVPAGEVLNITVGPGEKSCRLFGADGRPAEAVTDSTTTQLLFFGKPIMHVVWSICLQRLWKMGIILNDSASGVAQLDKSLSPHVFTIVFTSSRALRYPLLQRLAKSSNALVSAIRYAFKVTGGKQGQLETLRAHFESFGCTLDRSGVIPPSFIMDDPDDCKRFFLYSRSRPISWWVLKSSHGYGGQGITVLPNTTALRNRFGACNQREMFIVQEYLSRPLLLNGRKFDVRALVLIAGTSPYFLFHHDGYLRVSMRRFSFSQDRAVHLTNSHIQVAEKGFSADRHFWSFIQLQDYLDLHEPDNGDFVGRKLVPFVAKTATVILQAGISVFERLPSTFQLLGLDFMVTSDFQMRFIEANNYPLWPKGSKFIDGHMTKMGNSLFDLLFALRRDPAKFALMQPGDRFQSWQLVWSEPHALCSPQPTFNPCHAFRPPH